MQASDMLDNYILDVTNRLPRKIRDDVGFELRALLREEMQELRQHADGAPDEELLLQLLNRFGHPAEVAARYRQPITIIDPIDSHSFTYAAIVGVLIIWIAGLANILEQTSNSSPDVLQTIGLWWTSVGLAAFWWPGVLTVYFAIACRVRARSKATRLWRPHKIVVKDPGTVNRGVWLLLLAGMIAGLVILSEPARLLDMFLDRQASPKAYEALRYAPEFFPGRALWLFGMIALNVALYFMVMVRGQWTPMLRRIDMLMTLAVCLLLVWFSAAGQIFSAPVTDQFVKVSIGLIVFFVLLDKGAALYRELQRNYSPEISH